MKISSSGGTAGACLADLERAVVGLYPTSLTAHCVEMDSELLITTAALETASDLLGFIPSLEFFSGSETGNKATNSDFGTCNI